MLAQTEGHVSVKFLESNDRKPHYLTNLLSEEEFFELRNKDRKLRKLFEDMRQIYSEAYRAGFKIEPDSFGGFRLMNKTGEKIRTGEISCAVGLLGNQPKGRILDVWSLMEGDKLLVGVARWANHSCRANCDYYMAGGFNGRVCVRLCALREIEVGEELVTFCNGDFFGRGNKDCLCGNVEDHDKDSLSGNDISETVVTTKRRKRLKPAIKLIRSKKQSDLLGDMLRFYDELPSDSSTSKHSYLDQANSSVSDAAMLEECVVPYRLQTDTDVPEADIWQDSELKNATAVCESADFEISETSSDSERSGKAIELCPDQQTRFQEVTPVNLAASLISIVSKHNGSDALLNDLLKRDQKLFSNQSIAPWTIKTRFQMLCLRYQHTKQTLENGELILLNFRSLLLDIVKTSLEDMLIYAENKCSDEDLVMPTLKISNRRIKLRLILKTDGAVKCKSPPLSAWLVFFAFADLPPKKRQAFRNIVLVSLFVGTGYPDFDAILKHVKRECAVVETISFKNENIPVSFEPILFVADLLAKSKVLKMKQFNGYYGCTLCTLRGEHFGGIHHYSHSETFVMRSPESHLVTITELENGSTEMIRAKHGRKADCEKRTQGVKGRSEILSVIANQPLTSPVDPKHQLFLGVGKDVLIFFYDRMRPEHKSELNDCLSNIVLPIELKNTVRSLEALNNFKAKEIKTELLYLSPILVVPYLIGEERNSNKDDLHMLVYALHLLFESKQNTVFADKLLNEFCISMQEKTNKMDSINFHLLRHLGWQVKNIGPLFVWSAAMFESANRLLLAPLRGSVNHCELLVHRYIRTKLVQKMELQEDSLSGLLEDFGAAKIFDECFGLIETGSLIEFRNKNPEFKLSCRHQGTFYLTSEAYGRGNAADRFVAKMDDKVVGEVLFFFEHFEKMVVIRLFRILKSLKLVNSDSHSCVPYAFLVEKTEKTLEFPLRAVSHKLFSSNYKNNFYLITIMKHFEHN